MSSKRPPRPLAYGPDQDGLLDPDRPSIAERQRHTPERIAAERADKASRSPLIRALRAAGRAALKPGVRRR